MMKRVAVKKGDVVIRQARNGFCVCVCLRLCYAICYAPIPSKGDPGDWFYVVEAGEYKVTIKNAETDAEAEILRCAPYEEGAREDAMSI